jgi:mRNA-degrading endonuclease toxin of MazEF toxin-antitoxin module
MTGGRPRLLLVEPDPTGRLRLLAALSEQFEVVTLDDEEPVIRAARRLRPAVVLLGVPRVGARTVLRSCRSLKTEQNYGFHVGLVDRAFKLSDPRTAAETWLADGYVGGAATEQELADFAGALVRGERPVTVVRPQVGLLGRLLGRDPR